MAKRWIRLLPAILLLQGGALEALDFKLGFEGCPERMEVEPGVTEVSVEVFVTLTTQNNATERGAQGWSYGLKVAGADFDAARTFADQVADPHNNALDVEVLTTVDDDKNAATPRVDLLQNLVVFTRHPPSGEGFAVLDRAFTLEGPLYLLRGLVSAIVLKHWQMLAPSGTQRIARLVITAPVPSVVRLNFQAGLVGKGQPITNIVTFDGQSHTPTLGSCAFQVTTTGTLRGVLGPVIRLEDVTAGGDGSLTAPASNTGIDPRGGLFTNTRVNGRLSDSDGVNPEPVPSSPYIDSVFFLGPDPSPPTDPFYSQQITQSGVTATLNRQHATGSAWNYILKDRVGGISTEGILVGQQYLFATAVGIHASMGLTYDLNALRERHGDNTVGCFSTFWGMDDCATGSVETLAILSDDAGVLDTRSGLFTAGGGEFLTLEIPPQARYLTLATGSLGNDNCDHATFARPILSSLPCPEFSFATIWSISPSRVKPAGEPIIIDGDGMGWASTIKIGDSILTSSQLLSPTRRRGVVPPLPRGIYDVVAIDFTNRLIARAPLAIEVVPPPEIIAVAPARALFDRPTPVVVFGRDFRSDMTLVVDDVGFDEANAPLLDQQVLSDQVIVGALPPLAEGVDLGQKTLILIDQNRYVFYESIDYVDVGIERVEPLAVSTDGGTVVTFFGLNFQEGMAFRLGGLPLAGVEILDSGRARGISPPLPEGPYSADLADSSGIVISSLESTVLALPPGPLEIASLRPSLVYSLGGAVLTVALTGPHDGARLRAGGKDLVNQRAVDAVTLRGEVPTLAPGLYDVEMVDVSGNLVSSWASGLEVIADPAIAITSVEPSVVSTLGGAEIVITGTGFSPGFVPRIGGAPLEKVNVVSDTRLEGLSPLLEAGLHDMQLESGRLVLATLTGAVQSAAPDVPAGMVLGQVRPARLAGVGGAPVRFIGTKFPADLVPRIGGVALQGFHAVSPCRYEGAAPPLPAGFHRADLFRPGFGVVEVLDELVEVAASGSPPRPTHIVAPPVLPDGSSRVFVFGNDFNAQTMVFVREHALLSPTFVSSELIVGNAPPLGPAEEPGPRHVRAEDARGGFTLVNALRYEEPEGTSDPRFVRGDPNGSGEVDLSDPVYILGFLFLGVPSSVACEAALDADASESLDLSDAVFVLQYLFLGGPPMPAPYPGCGVSTSSLLGCRSFSACGGGGGQASQVSFYENVKVLSESPANPLDPKIVELAAEEGEIVVHDPPGGVEIRPGDVIAGFTPVHLNAVHNGVAYLLKVESLAAGSCLAGGAGDKVFKVRPASLREAVKDGEIRWSRPDFSGAKVSLLQQPRVDACAIVSGGGQAGASPHFLNEDFGFISVLDLQQQQSYLRTRFNKSRVRYDQATELAVSIADGTLSQLSLRAGVRLDLEVDFHVEASNLGSLEKETPLVRVEQAAVVLLGSLPIQLTASADLIAGMDLEAGTEVDLDAGVSASYQTQLAFRVDGQGVHNLSSIERPQLALLPHTPVFGQDGAAVVRGYIRPELQLSSGLLTRAGRGEVQVRPEVFARARVPGAGGSPCSQWDIDAALKAVIDSGSRPFGYDIFDATVSLLDEEWNDVLQGEGGCQGPPVVILNHQEESVSDELLVHLDASGSYDPDGGELRFFWDFNDDGACDRNTGSSSSTTYVIDPAADSPCRRGICAHELKLRVLDDEDTFTERRVSFATRGGSEGLSRVEVPIPY